MHLQISRDSASSACFAAELAQIVYGRAFKFIFKHPSSKEHIENVSKGEAHIRKDGNRMNLVFSAFKVHK